MNIKGTHKPVKMIGMMVNALIPSNHAVPVNDRHKVSLPSLSKVHPVKYMCSDLSEFMKTSLQILFHYYSGWPDFKHVSSRYLALTVGRIVKHGCNPVQVKMKWLL